EDVGQLQGDAGRLGVALRFTVGEAPDVDARQADHRGDAVAVPVKVVEGAVAVVVEVHAEAVDGGVQILGRDSVGADGVGEGGVQRVPEGAGQGEVELAAEGVELAALVGGV